MNRFFSRFSEFVDIVAGTLLGVIGILIFVSTLGRRFFAAPIADTADLSRLLLGALIMWGFAALGYRGGHITADVLYELFSERWRKYIDIFAWFILLVFAVLLCWKMYENLTYMIDSGRTTRDLRIPEWPFLAVIWLGSVAAVITISARLLSLVLGRDWSQQPLSDNKEVSP